jgi:NAD+ synthase (glutamine-hydrolysing)
MLGQLRLVLAQINPTVGDIAGNCLLIEKVVAQAAGEGAHLVVFPEMVITGYPVEDLALRPSFRQASKVAISTLAKQIAKDGYGDLVLVVGYLDEASNFVNRLGQPQGAPQNAAAIIHEGKIKARYVKHHLPNYGVFDEFRNFVRGEASLVVRIHGIDVGVAICEDIWQEGGTVAELRNRTPGLVVVPNGSPYERNKDDVRLALVRQRVSEIGAPIAYVNMSGGQDDLVFDGDTIVVGTGGELLARAPQFEDRLLVVDLELKAQTSNPDLVLTGEIAQAFSSRASEVAPRLDDLGEVWTALVVGLRDYIAKNNFETVLVAISGGIDSALVASIAVDALGADQVFGVSLPSKFSSSHSLTDAEELASNTRLHYRVIEIELMVEAFLKSMLLDGIAQENVLLHSLWRRSRGIRSHKGHLQN